MLKKSRGCFISLETPRPSDDICSWVHVRKVSDDHRPYFLIITMSIFDSLSAIAFFTRNEYGHILDKVFYASFRILLMSLDATCDIPFTCLHAHIIVLGSLEHCLMSVTICAITLTGQMHSLFS